MNNVFNENNNVNKPITNKIKETTGNGINALKNIGQRAANTVSNEFQKTKSNLQNAANVSKTYQSIARGSKTLSLFARDFSENNSTVSKFVFILFIVIIFGLLIRVGVYIISLFTLPQKSPIIVNGMLSTKSLTKYQVNPSLSNSKPILRSVNENQGMEFTWSTWIFIDNASSGVNKNPKRIFSKGGNSETGNAFAMNSPGLYLYDGVTSNTNAIGIVMTTFGDTGLKDSLGNIHERVIKNIPIQKWVNVITRVQNRTIDIYVNGVLSIRDNLPHVIKQNYGDIFVGDDANGMDGFVSSLRYFDYAIGNMKIQEIIQQGPNLKMIGNKNLESAPPYLATRWYLDNIE